MVGSSYHRHVSLQSFKTFPKFKTFLKFLKLFRNLKLFQSDLNFHFPDFFNCCFLDFLAKFPHFTHSEVASNFSKIFGVVQILCLVIAPIAGLIMDHQVNKANLEVDPIKRQLNRIQAGFWPMMFTTSTLSAILICRFFNNPVAIYTSIIFITLLRSFLIAVASAYLRIRFVFLLVITLSFNPSFSLSVLLFPELFLT